MTTSNQPNCLIRQSACGLQAGQTECPKCGIRTDVRYVSQEDLDMAVAKGTALYWQNHAQAMERTIAAQEKAKREQLERAEIERAKAAAARIAETERKEQLERAEIERAKAEAARVQAQKEKQEAEAHRAQEKAAAFDEVNRRAQEKARHEAAEHRTAQERAEREQLERAKAESALAQAQKEKQEAEARRAQHKAAVMAEVDQRAQETARRELEQMKWTGPMVVLPQGHFLMGSADDDPNGRENERPQHKVTIGYRLAMAKFPVTFFMWDACIADGGVTHRPDDCGWGRGHRPVINVSWHDAHNYVNWLNKKLGIAQNDPNRYRLPSEAEWEYACRAGTNTAYWWGNEFDPSRANGSRSMWQVVFRNFSNDTGNKTLPIGHFGLAAINPYGLHDVHGNVWEWVRDNYVDTFQRSPTDGSAFENAISERVLRGGSWGSTSDELRSAQRHQLQPDRRSNGIGFRLARTLP